MTFYTVSKEPRPVRLVPGTRQWAQQSLDGVYGKEALGHMWLEMDGEPGFEAMSALEKYDASIRKIALEAFIRICPMERVSGAATLGGAIRHCVPTTYHGKPVCEGVSHLTISLARAIQEGMDSYADEIDARLNEPGLPEKRRAVFQSMRNTLESMRLLHGRYLAATKEENPETHALLSHVPFQPARSFHEAVQTIWFVFAFTRLCGNWPGLGRIDQLLGAYLERDLINGVLTIDQAREILASLFIKGCEWICGSETAIGTGDAQHYQNIVLAGVDEDGNEITNDVTYLVLDIVEELPISDFPISVRVGAKTPQKLIRRIAEVMRHGGGVVAVYGEELVMQAMQNAGYPLSEARKFANDGCWEVQVPGNTNFRYMPFDALQLFDAALCINTDGEIPNYRNIEEVYAAFLEKLRAKVEDSYRANVLNVYTRTDSGWENPAAAPATVISLFVDGCVENGRMYSDLGPKYTVRSPHIGGAPDVSNSLYAISKLVFEEEKISFEDLVRVLRNNWDGAEPLRQYVRSRYTYYGNDNDEADAWAARVLNDFAAICGEFHSDIPVLFVPGVSTFGRQVNWLPERKATAFGARKGDILSGNDSPTPGTDYAGATAVVRSYCKAELARQTTGSALDVKLYPDTVAGENGLVALEALIGGFVRLGGFFLQVDTVDAEVLKEAQRDPEHYRTLSVRVSGWNARFVTLDEEWQRMIIERTSQNV